MYDSDVTVYGDRYEIAYASAARQVDDDEAGDAYRLVAVQRGIHVKRQVIRQRYPHQEIRHRQIEYEIIGDDVAKLAGPRDGQYRENVSRNDHDEQEAVYEDPNVFTGFSCRRIGQRSRSVYALINALVVLFEIHSSGKK